MNKKLVVYFSASGITQKTAAKVAQAAGADLFEIKPETPYTQADLDWTNQKSRSTVEMRDDASRPAMAEKFDRLADYDTVFLGFPIWWSAAPTIVNTFLESGDFSGKTIVLFGTSGGGGFGKTREKLQKSAPDSVIWLSEKLLTRASDQEIKTWLAGLSLDD